MNDPSDSPGGPEVAERFRGLSPEEVDPRLVQLAAFLAGRLERDMDTVEARGFVHLSVIALHDLRQGVDGFTQEPIEHPLARQDEAVYDQLRRAVPQLGAIGVSVAFGKQVQDIMVAKGILPLPEASQETVLDPTEIITDPIDDVERAQALIVDDARRRILELDWQPLGVLSDLIDDEFDKYYAHVLRLAPFRLPISVLSARHMPDVPVMAELPESHKKPLSNDRWLCMLMTYIPGEYATVTRDFLYLKIVEVVAMAAELDTRAVIHRFALDTHGPYMRAVQRYGIFVADHPELMRPSGGDQPK